MAKTGSAPGGKITAGRAILEKLRARTPYYERNKARICSFWVKGNCTRGERCPYRHEMPKDPDTPLAKQSMRDRYYGNNDPVAAKMLATHAGVFGEGRKSGVDGRDTFCVTLYASLCGVFKKCVCLSLFIEV